MAEFDKFAFVRNRLYGIHPSDTDLDKFDLFSTNVVISMSQDPYIEEFLNKTNSLKFSKLNKKTQCMAFTSLDGKQLMGKWALPKAESKAESKSYIEKVMKVLDCSVSDAEVMTKAGTLNKFDVDMAYDAMYSDIKPKRRK